MRSGQFIKITPRWLIFIIDQVLICAAFILSVSLIRGLRPGLGPGLPFETAFLINTIISIVLALYFKTYCGKPSHAGIRDIVRIMQFSMLHLVTWFLILTIAGKEYSIPGLAIGFPVINASIISVFLTGFRLLTRSIYNRSGQPVDRSWKSSMFHVDELTDITIGALLERDESTFQYEGTAPYFDKSVVLVSGAAGSIGSEICRQLSGFDITRIVLLDQSESGLFDFQFELRSRTVGTDICVEVGSVRDKQRIEALFLKYRPHYVFHAAAYKHVPIMESIPSEAILTNVLGTQILADMAIRYKVRKFILVSTDKAVNPTNVMGATKGIAEMYIQSVSGRSGATEFITTRFGNVLGSTGSVVPLFIKQILRGGPITITHPEVTRYFMTIPEASRLVVAACVIGTGEEIFVFNMGKPVKILEIARKLIRLAGYTEGKEIPIEFIGLRKGEKIHEELFSESEDLMPTHHPEIMMAKARAFDIALFSRQLEELVDHALLHRQEDVRCLLQKMLPENKE